MTLETDRILENTLAEREVLEALLVTATPDGARLPTIQEFILSEVVNGTLEYACGSGGEITFQKFRMDSRSFERRLWENFERQMKTPKIKLNRKINMVIAGLAKPYQINPTGPDRLYTSTNLYANFKGDFGVGICEVHMRSTFSLPHETFVRVESKILPSLSEKERRDVIGIGTAMRQYVKEDLKFTGKTYHW